MTRQASGILLLKVVLGLAFAALFLLPIGFWVFLNLHYGWIPEEATAFGLDLRTVLVCISGFGLFMLLLTFLIPLRDERRMN